MGAAEKLIQERPDLFDGYDGSPDVAPLSDEQVVESARKLFGGQLPPAWEERVRVVAQERAQREGCAQ